MKTYRGIYVSPEFHADFKAFAAKQRKNMGELTEEIVTEYMKEAELRNTKEVEGK